VIRVELRSGLRVRGGKLAPKGVAVHAATFLRERRIILDQALLRRPRELRRIFVHELLHFAWWKLGNPRRLDWESLLAREIRAKARGELGWSAEIRKHALTDRDIPERTRAWREYCCESFCDTGASILFEGKKHEEFTLAARFRIRRQSWFRQGDIIRDEEQLVQFVEPRDGRGGFVWVGDVPCLLAGADGARSIDEGIQRSERGA
jgi:hypothetical protein